MGKADFPKLTQWLTIRKKIPIREILEKYGKLGVDALRETTPKDTGLTSRSWRYEIEESNGKAKLSFLNSNIQNGENVAILIQLGHGTRSGAWVEGRDYINPALSGLADEMDRELKQLIIGR